MTAHPARRLWTVFLLCALAVAFDGYDLVVYGTTVPALMAQWHIGPAQAGTLGSYALIGMLLGALLTGTLTDYVGRRRMLLLCVTWFSVFTVLCAAAPSPEVFAVLRLLGGLGLGGLMPTAAALVVEYAPPGRANLTYVMMQSGYAVGGILASALAIPLLPVAGWRVMYLIAAVPVLVVVPLGWKLLPESLEHLVLTGRTAEATQLAAALGRPVPQLQRPQRRSWTVALRGLVAPGQRAGTLLLWATAFCALLTVYGMNTWLPQIMRQAHFSLGSALTFLLVFNLGSIAGSFAGGRAADRFGSRPVIAVSFLLAAAGIGLLLTRPPTIVLYVLIAVAGYGTIGTQNLLNVHITRHYPARLRSAGVGWALGVGRLGAILGPPLGGFVLASGAGYQWNFVLFGAAALLGTAAITLVPARSPEPHPVRTELKERTA